MKILRKILLCFLTFSIIISNLIYQSTAQAISLPPMPPGLPIAVTGVTLSKTSMTVKDNACYYLTATVSPSNATNKSVSWSSSNTSVAKVDSSGMVTPISPGTATITVKTADGGKTAKCTVTVVSSTVAVTGVTLSKTSMTVKDNACYYLTATVSPSNATNKSVSWSSSNTSVAKVDSSGMVTPVSPGTATITVKTADGGKTATCTVNVESSDVPVTEVTLSRTSILASYVPESFLLSYEDTKFIDKKYYLTATVSPSNATNKSVSWSSSNTSVAKVNSSGMVTPVSPGTATITVKTADGGKIATCTVIVENILTEQDDYKFATNFVATYYVSNNAGTAVRNKPSSKSAIIKKLDYGDLIQVTAQWENSGNTWYQIAENEFVLSQDLRLDKIDMSQVKDFNETMMQSIQRVTRNAEEFEDLAFIVEFLPGGDYDLKSTDEWGYWYRKHYVMIDNKLYYLDSAQLGNILYGFVGSVFYTESELLERGDFVSLFTSLKHDSIEDQNLIKYGVNYFETGSFTGLEDIPYMIIEGDIIVQSEYKEKIDKE